MFDNIVQVMMMMMIVMMMMMMMMIMLTVTGLPHLIPRLSLNGWDTLGRVTSMEHGDIVNLDIRDRDRERLETIVTVLRYLTGVQDEAPENSDLRRERASMTMKDSLKESFRDSRLCFAETLAKFDDNPKSRMIPVCGVRPVQL